MRYLLDTNIVFPHLANDTLATALITRLAHDGIAVSTITLMETWQGMYRSVNLHEAEAQYRMFFDAITILPFDDAIAKRCAQLRHDLQQVGSRIRPRALDLMIAATALEHALELMTQNQSDFSDIPGLVRYQF